MEERVELRVAEPKPAATIVASKGTLTERQKIIFLIMKAGFAFSWGFINAITFHIAGKYATIMTGNLLILAVEAQDWAVQDLLVTAVIMITYILSSATYDAIVMIKNGALGETSVVRFFLIPIILICGILADVLLYTLEDSSSQSQEESLLYLKENCLRFLAPLSSIAGLVAGGYCSSHPDGITTNVMDSHVRVFPNTMLKIIFTEQEPNQRQLLKDQAKTSTSLITCFFVGALAGGYAKDAIVFRHSQGLFSPVLTCFGCAMAILCFSHHSFWNRCFDDCLEVEDVENKLEKSFSVRRMSLECS